LPACLIFAHEEHWLDGGDSVHFDGRICHRLVTGKNGGAKLLVVHRRERILTRRAL
jgi:hypothetical protein